MCFVRISPKEKGVNFERYQCDLSGKYFHIQKKKWIDPTSTCRFVGSYLSSGFKMGNREIRSRHFGFARIGRYALL